MSHREADDDRPKLMQRRRRRENDLVFLDRVRAACALEDIEAIKRSYADKFPEWRRVALNRAIRRIMDATMAEAMVDTLFTAEETVRKWFAIPHTYHVWPLRDLRGCEWFIHNDVLVYVNEDASFRVSGVADARVLGVADAYEHIKITRTTFDFERSDFYACRVLKARHVDNPILRVGNMVAALADTGCDTNIFWHILHTAKECTDEAVIKAYAESSYG